jgi:hypothetical protein
MPVASDRLLSRVLLERGKKIVNEGNEDLNQTLGLGATKA